MGGRLEARRSDGGRATGEVSVLGSCPRQRLRCSTWVNTAKLPSASGVTFSRVTCNSGAPERCVECGAKVLTKCAACNTRVRGRYRVEGVVGGGYNPPSFCDKCGSPFPWVDRQGRIYQLENLLDDEDLDPAEELTVREQLEALRDPDLSEEEQQKRWERVRRGAPGLWEKSGARSILESVVSAAIRQQLGL